MLNELKPCPFCGAVAEMQITKHIPNGNDYTPRCTNTSCCGRLSKKYTLRATAVAMWNRRADNVIVPPCKVGQTVWLIMSLNLQQTEWEIKEGKISMIQQKADKSWKFRVTENHSVQDYTVDKIGKTVFLTKEDAEAKLKEMER